MSMTKLAALAAVCCGLASTVLAQAPADDDRVIWITNGTVPGEKFVGLLNRGAKNMPHKIDIRFDALDGVSVPHHPDDIALFDLIMGIPVPHPRDSFGANVMPQKLQLFKVTPRKRRDDDNLNSQRRRVLLHLPLSP